MAQKTLTLSAETHYKNRHHCSQITCPRCQKAIKYGEKVEVRIITGKAKYYHVNCWRMLQL